MDLKELRLFVEVAAAGSLSRAGAQLGLSQPTLSRQLGKLEAEMRTELFYRHGRGVALTRAGHRLLDVTAAALQQLDAVRDELQARTLDELGEITLGIPPSIAATVGAELAAGFAAAHPRAHLRMRESFSGVLMEWVETGRIDLAVLYEARRSPNILATPLLLEDLFLVEQVNSGLDHSVEISELATRPCLLPGPGNGLRRVVDAACWAERIKPLVYMEIDCVAALKQLVERGVGCTVLPFGAVHREVAEGRLSARTFISPAMRAMLVIATAPSKPVTPLIRSVIHMLQAEVRSLARDGILRGDTHDF